MTDAVFQRCIHPHCGHTTDLHDTTFQCAKCGGLYDVAYDWNRLPAPTSFKHFEAKWANRTDPLDFSGVWRFRDLFPFAPPDRIMTIGEGQTLLQKADQVGKHVGMKPGNLFLQYEGMNPSGSFKDNGMTAAFTHAQMVGARRAACASTGNTSASLAIYCAATNLMRAVIFIGSGKISYGKLSQALDYGALTVQIAGDFDDALRRVQEVSKQLGIYLVNSINPFRLEGQKSVMYRILEAMRWEVPDWIVVPGGNLGNVSAFGKAFFELKELGLIDRMPRLALINAAGADTFYQLYEKNGVRWNGGKPDSGKINAYMKYLDDADRRADTLASAIEINRPVNLPKALRSMERCGGYVREVTDQEILDAKAKIGAGGFGCEPASAASVAGLLKLVKEGVISPDERVACVLTGHVLKDSDATVAYHTADPATFEAKLGKRGVRRASYANRAVQVPNDLSEIVKAIELFA
ncbi:threonine synthase [Limnoglobus roseus]|uniref:Threonine synthase n=1 Tax=Limnoglobus roseus TaxID=2598579 RepID=A0A5C1A4H7_9BACT|nr:threonine synthase [Limnoglobus roseus]QEL13287.1 threonine synthase [Limnoglobus roseus]